MRLQGVLLGLALVGSLAPGAAAQAHSDQPDPLSRAGRWKPILASAGLVVVGVGLDRTFHDWVQAPSFQRNVVARDAATVFEPMGSPWPALASVGLYAGSVAARQHEAADIALHVAVGVVAASTASGILKATAGRARPWVSPGDSDVLAPLRALGGDTGYTSFPSGHTTAAFALAASLSAELRRRWPEAAPAAPVALYTAASLTGFARVFHDRHWVTDVLAGAALGHWVGTRVVERAHSDAGPGTTLEPLVGRGPDGRIELGLRVGTGHR